MKGVRVRIDVNSWYTPSVRRGAATEKHRTRRYCIGRRAARRLTARLGREEYDLAMGRGSAEWRRGSRILDIKKPRDHGASSQSD
jgi:hypothetical protein